MESCGTAVGSTASRMRRGAGQHVIGRGAARLAVDAEPGRGVALRIEVDDQHVLADGGERGAEIDRGRGLADAALLVGDRQHPRAAGAGSARTACRTGRPGRSVACGLAACRSCRARPVRACLGRVVIRVVRTSSFGASCERWQARGRRQCEPSGLVLLGTFSASMFQYLAASVNSASTSCPLGNRPMRAALRSEETPDRTGFSAAPAPARVTTSTPCPASFPQISQRAC